MQTLPNLLRRLHAHFYKWSQTRKMTSLVHFKLDKIKISTNTTFTQCFNNIRQNKRCP